MNWMKAVAVGLIAFVVSVGLGCSNRQQAPDVTSDIRHALDQAGLKDVKVSQDRVKAVVSLTGDVATDADKSRAETIAHSIAGDQVVSNEIGVRPKATWRPIRRSTRAVSSAAAMYQHSSSSRRMRSHSSR